LLTQLVIVDVMRSTEKNGTKEGKKRGMFKMWINYSADNCPIDQLNA